MKYWVVEDEDEEEIKYSNILQEEEYEDEDPPEAFEGLQKGSNITDEFDQSTVKPWDPSDIFFVYI